MNTRLTRFWFVVLAFTVASSLPAEDADNVAKRTMKLLTGEWETVSRIKDGEKLPDPEGGQRRVVIRDGKFTVTAGGKNLGMGSFTLDASKKPMAIDMKFDRADRTEVKYLGIIEVGEGEHRICWAEPGKSRPTTFAADKGSGHTVAVYRRVKQN